MSPSFAPDNTYRASTQMTQHFFPAYARVIGTQINRIGQWFPALACRLTMKVLSISLRKRLKPADYRLYTSSTVQRYQYRKHIYYTYTYGVGPSILLLHGWCSHGGRWESYISPLVKKGYQVVVMDAPGHGMSPGQFLSVPDYIACVKEVLAQQPKWFALLAHSMGSLTGTIAASELNLRFDRCILMSTFSHCDALMSKFALGLGVSESILASTRAWIKNYTGEPLAHFSLLKHLSCSPESTLLIADRQDKVVPLEEFEQISTHFPTMPTVLTNGLGHNLRSAKLRSQVIEFLSSH